VAEDGATRVAAARVWFATADSDASQIGSWDVKTALTVRAILATLAAGCAIMLGVTRDGGAVHITIYDGEAKHRVYIADSVEWDDAMDAVLQTAQPQPRLHIAAAD
jgi:hypothetical protein